jgi:hypothetical protein
MAKVTITLTLDQADLVRDIVKAEYVHQLDRSDPKSTTTNDLSGKERNEAGHKAIQIGQALREFA